MTIAQAVAALYAPVLSGLEKELEHARACEDEYTAMETEHNDLQDDYEVQTQKIDTLQQENKRLREALERISDLSEGDVGDASSRIVSIAEQALQPSKSEEASCKDATNLNCPTIKSE
jgi:hypothetical protein